MCKVDVHATSQQYTAYLEVALARARSQHSGGRPNGPSGSGLRAVPGRFAFPHAAGECGQGRDRVRPPIPAARPSRVPAPLLQQYLPISGPHAMSRFRVSSGRSAPKRAYADRDGGSSIGIVRENRRGERVARGAIVPMQLSPTNTTPLADTPLSEGRGGRSLSTLVNGHGGTLSSGCRRGCARRLAR